MRAGFVRARVTEALPRRLAARRIGGFRFSFRKLKRGKVPQRLVLH
jgi:hypothetical protein